MQANVYEFLKESPKSNLLIVSNEKEAIRAAEVANFLGYDTFIFCDFRANFGDDLNPFKDELFDILSSLNSFYQSSSKKKIIISPIRSVLNPLPKKELLSSFKLSFADNIKLEELKDKLYFWGYSFVDIVQEEGEVSFRGDIVDIFSRGESKPVRVSLFDDEIESIRYFEPSSQKSQQDELEEITIQAALFSLNKEQFEQISQRVEEIESDSFVKDIRSLGLWVLEDLGEDLLESLNPIKISSLTQDIKEIFSFIDDEDKKQKLLSLDLIETKGQYKDIEVADISSFMEFHKDKQIKVIANSKAILKQYDLPNIPYTHIEAPYIVNLLGDDELILSLNKTQKAKRRRKSKIVLDELKMGDYVVHESYGVGIFKGLINTTVLGTVRDFIEIVYQNDEKVLLPVENIDLIDRYIADGGSLAVVDRLGKGSFAKLKSKVKAKLFEIAKDIVEIAAKRELIEAPVIRSDFEDIALFQAGAGFEYTQDQQKSIQEIFTDMQSSKVMDRLLSGDVGFGKTEVAMNAIFATYLSGYQSALIAPTTLLVSQHYKSIKERLDKFGLKLAKLDRFTSTKAKKEILNGLKSGDIHLCIGTHALLGVEFKNLGLLIIDEEHKFGVKQKEKLKELRSNMHILSMSATPIPRSLNMALSSIKQYSQLLTPPLEREDVRSFVKEFSEPLLKEVILREKRRGGQIFYVHNRIASIEQKKAQILEILPDLKILVLHSKIPPSTTEKEVLAFEEGKYDLLLSTSIVESGIHMPNVNTIIIDEADRFGMADLHQLRGRVGRGSRQGYCYFFVNDKNSLSEDASKRLLALESNSFLGAGSVLAYHDLEIRGGGNLVGEAQSGHIKGIGYSLYLKMLEDALKTLMEGNIQKEEQESKCEVKLSISAYISSDLINEDRLRLELYRRLSKCQSPKEVYEIEEEMEDRFGKLDQFTKQFLELIIIKILSSQKGIKLLSNYKENITIEYQDGKKEYLKSKSKDDDDIIATVLNFLRK